jgi:hypothetical protein
MRQAFTHKAPSGKVNSEVSRAELRYWRAGARRALQGRVDVWDTALASFLIENNFQTILPPIPLVTNIGNDEFATHTKESSQFLNVKTGVLDNSGSAVARVSEVDSWMKNNFYKIAIRHLLTTRITQLIDFTKLPVTESLEVRFRNSMKDFEG